MLLNNNIKGLEEWGHYVPRWRWALLWRSPFCFFWNPWARSSVPVPLPSVRTSFVFMGGLKSLRSSRIWRRELLPNCSEAITLNSITLSELLRTEDGNRQTVLLRLYHKNQPTEFKCLSGHYAESNVTPQSKIGDKVLLNSPQNELLRR